MREITIEELAAGDLQVIDVREDHEWDEGHVPGAVHIPLGAVVERVSEIPDGAAIICRSGGRSARAVEWLETQGIDVVNVAGGTQAWIASGRDVVIPSDLERG